MAVVAIGVAICVPVLALLFAMAMERLERALLAPHPSGDPGAGDQGTEATAPIAIGPVSLPGRPRFTLRSAGRLRPAGAVPHRRDVTDSRGRDSRRRGSRRAGPARDLEDARRAVMGDEQADEA